MNVDFVVPYFPAPRTDRASSVLVLWEMYAESFGHDAGWGWELSCDRRDGRAASIAASRNEGARSVLYHLPRMMGDVLVFNDADSLCKPGQIRKAVRLAAEAPGLVFAFTNYCRLSQRATEELTSWRDAFDAPVEWEMYGSNSSGCVAISRESFLQVGGYDETWLDGYEDYDFAFRCAEMFGPNRRVEGDLIHLWHPRPAVEPENGRDRERFEKKWLAPH